MNRLVIDEQLNCNFDFFSNRNKPLKAVKYLTKSGIFRLRT